MTKYNPVHACLDYTLMDYSHLDDRRLDHTQLDYLWRLDHHRLEYKDVWTIQLDYFMYLDY